MRQIPPAAVRQPAAHAHHGRFQTPFGAADLPLRVDFWAEDFWSEDFWAEWCSFCRRIAPVIDQAAAFELRLRVGRLDTEAEPDLGRASAST
ncbi:thioredoxin family protein [uncultured Ferrovibrio sp.]|uniref:thioredoxin family protein n=1 Tax=uncultured Ferrovibrio sp. TaxID=1576913 RepID=UPI00262A4A9C|nr:thioredoxin family protein [uncultured Ferrovibrio sp.]